MNIRRAFTLVELLVVILIVLIIAAILTVVYVRSQSSAQESVMISNLRSIGQAAAIYETDNSGFVWHHHYLASAQVIPVDLLSHPQDKTEQGHGTIIREGCPVNLLGIDLPDFTARKDSGFAISDCVSQNFLNETRLRFGDSIGGWLIFFEEPATLNSAEPDRTLFDTADLRYHRLNFDSSVVFRRNMIRPLFVNGEEIGVGIAPLERWFDFYEEK